MEELDSGVSNAQFYGDGAQPYSLEQMNLTDLYGDLMGQANWDPKKAWVYARADSAQHAPLFQRRRYAVDRYNELLETFMSNNAISRQTQDMKNAGLNPAILYSSGVGSGSPVVGSSGSSGGQSGVSGFLLGLLSLLMHAVVK